MKTDEELFLKRSIKKHRKLRPGDRIVDYELYWEPRLQRWSAVITSEDGDKFVWHSVYELYVDE